MKAESSPNLFTKEINDKLTSLIHNKDAHLNEKHILQQAMHNKPVDSVAASSIIQSLSTSK